MPTPPHQPPALPDRCFSTSEALARGLTLGQLKGSAYTSVFNGVWTLADRALPEPPAQQLLDILPALQEALPEAVASHITAAVLLGLRLPHRLRVSTPLHLTRRTSGEPFDIAGVDAHKSPVPNEDLIRYRHLRMTGPTRTVVDLAGMRAGPRRWLLSSAEMVALLDGIINEHRFGYSAGRPAMRGLPAVEQDLRRMTGRRGVARIRTALARARVGADSALETRARLVLEDHRLHGWVLDTQISAPNHRDVHPDLADPVHKIAIQIEGPHHDEQAQRIRDIDRQRATEAASWAEIRATVQDLFPSPYGPPNATPRIVELVRRARRRRRP